VRQAGALVRLVQAEMTTPAMTKDDRSPVTVGDYAVQALVAHHLEQAFPEAVLVAEEDSQALRLPSEAATLERVVQFVQRYLPDATPEQVCTWIDRGAGQPTGSYWVLDPIDGTKGFLRGGQYVVALAYIENAQVQAGILGCPNLTQDCQQEIGGTGSLAVAQRGRGAWMVSMQETGSETTTQTILRVSNCTDPRQIRLLSSYEAAHTNMGVIDRLMEGMGVQAEAVRLDSQAKYALLAGGYGEIMVRLPPDKNPGYKEKIWDQAAGSLIVEEAGGKITDLLGHRLDFSAGRMLENNRGVLASNGPLHDRIVASLAALAA